MPISVTTRSGARMVLAAAGWLLLASSAPAHHSYAMFDGSRTLTINGTVAKLEWVNPHVYLWVYVANAKAQGGHDLYAFENGSPNVLARAGWSKSTFKAGETIAVEFWPLKDRRTGGHFRKATHADGRVSLGMGGPNADKVERP